MGDAGDDILDGGLGTNTYNGGADTDILLVQGNDLDNTILAVQTTESVGQLDDRRWRG